jgi:predicted lipoprotein with Yx(FWY)xxD motif
VSRVPALAFVMTAMLVGLAASASGAPRHEPRPPGVSVRMTIEGPIFIDQRGFSLYWRDPECGDSLAAPIVPVSTDGALGVQATATRRRSCLQKNPPLLASADAQPVGRWSILVRSNGVRQWTYDGRPIHRSTKDRAPGEINGSYPTRLGRGVSPAAAAPLEGAPSGVNYRVTAAGLALTNNRGRALYYRTSGSCRDRCEQTWRPLTAPIIATTDQLSSDWTIVTRRDGARQWAYKNHPLYTYVNDTDQNSEQVFGDAFGGTWSGPIRGWSVALLRPAPRHPADVTVQALAGDPQLFSFGLPSVVYANRDGMTLYTMHCSDSGVDRNEEGVSCDDVGDDPRYWLSFCGGEERCAATWRPLPAPASARALDDVWSVVTINPRNAFQPSREGAAERVWAYRGRVVFTYAHDQLRGDYYGDDNGFGTTGLGQMTARPIPAFTQARVAPPVVQLQSTDGAR